LFPCSRNLKKAHIQPPFYGSSILQPVTFGTIHNYRTKYSPSRWPTSRCPTTYLVSSHAGSLHGHPAPHYLVLKMPPPSGIHSVYGDIDTSYKCDVKDVELTKTLVYFTLASAMVLKASKIDKMALEVLEYRHTDTTLEDLRRRGFASSCLKQRRRCLSGPTSTPNRNSCSPVSFRITQTYFHGVHQICRVSQGSWLSTP
jgi:hypothetical protein